LEQRIAAEVVVIIMPLTVKVFFTGSRTSFNFLTCFLLRRVIRLVLVRLGITFSRVVTLESQEGRDEKVPKLDAFFLQKSFFDFADGKMSLVKLYDVGFGFF
jgi:hypothetical protein